MMRAPKVPTVAWWAVAGAMFGLLAHNLSLRWREWRNKPEVVRLEEPGDIIRRTDQEAD